MGRARYSVREEIRDTVDSFYRAISNRNLKAVDAVWAHTAYATVAGSSGTIHHGWEGVRNFWDMRFRHVDARDVNVKLVSAACNAVGDVGWMSGIERRTYKTDEACRVEDFRMTCVLERTGSGWQIVSYHVSASREEQVALAPAS
jgi:ketosteroid isomerase-like protein